jgi:hypothetical protein
MILGDQIQSARIIHTQVTIEPHFVLKSGMLPKIPSCPWDNFSKSYDVTYLPYNTAGSTGNR